MTFLNLSATHLGLSQSVKTFGVAVSSEFHTSDVLWKYCTVQGLCIKQKDNFLRTTVTLNWRLILVSLLP